MKYKEAVSLVQEAIRQSYLPVKCVLVDREALEKLLDIVLSAESDASDE